VNERVESTGDGGSKRKEGGGGVVEGICGGKSCFKDVRMDGLNECRRASKAQGPENAGSDHVIHVT